MAAKTPDLMSLLTMAPSAFVEGDLGSLPQIKSLAALRKEVERHFGHLTGRELEALVGWFNRNFFRLEK